MSASRDLWRFFWFYLLLAAVCVILYVCFELRWMERASLADRFFWGIVGMATVTGILLQAFQTAKHARVKRRDEDSQDNP
jgi:hypothetical protein